MAVVFNRWWLVNSQPPDPEAAAERGNLGPAFRDQWQHGVPRIVMHKAFSATSLGRAGQRQRDRPHEQG
jgi:hypothetical protein